MACKEEVADRLGCMFQLALASPCHQTTPLIVLRSSGTTIDSHSTVFACGGSTGPGGMGGGLLQLVMASGEDHASAGVPPSAVATSPMG
jgi:hypothetical protein